jgi:HD-GYP domain-containing protein (c-di-GMP phosphodiesterase class II)
MKTVVIESVRAGTERAPGSLVEAETVEEMRAALLHAIGRQVGAASDLSQMMKQLVDMTKHFLNSEAGSVLLMDEETNELIFEVAEGGAGSALKQVRISINSGIAGWVARNRQPLIINDVSCDERFYKNLDMTTGFKTRSIMAGPLIVHGELIGVIEVLNKSDGSDYSQQDLITLESVAATAAIALENTRLSQSIAEGYKATIRALAAAIDAKDKYTLGHSQRVTEFALLAGTALKMTKKELEMLEYGCILHDVGKIGIPDAILRKPAELSPAEFLVIRRHPAIGADIIKGVPFLEDACKLVMYHHERYDGKGYPFGLKGEEIPLAARVLAVADTYDSMTTDRAYRKALSVEAAIKELEKHAGTQFCPLAVKAFTLQMERHNHFLQRGKKTDEKQPD